MSPSLLFQVLHNEPWQIRAQEHAALIDLARQMAARPPVAEQHSSYPSTATAEEMGISLSAGFAFVPISGILDRNADYWDCKYLGFASMRVIERQIEWIAGRADVHSVVFLMNTPGGRVPGGPELSQRIEELGKSKRTVAWIDIVCASLGYRLAAPCHEIYMPPSSIVGSVSTLMALVDSSKAWAEQGLKHEVFTDGELKDLGIAGRPLTEAHRAHLVERLDQVGGEFKSYIARHRPAIPVESMNGGDYTGDRALELGFVDGFFGNLTDLVAYLIDSHRSQ